jgi:ABC-type nickel/cobalt efflux system permease component RcnA
LLLLAKLLMVLLAGSSLLLLGMLHALEPGHGKGLVLATMIGEQRHRWRDVASLALSVTLTHALSVFGLAVVLSLLVQGGLALTQHQATQQLALVVMHVVSAIIIMILGVRLFIRAGQSSLGSSTDCCDGPLHHTHSHSGGGLASTAQPSTQEAKPLKPTPLWWLGVACGLTPCPVALATLLVALNASHWQHLGWMLLALLVFSAGLGVSVGLVGVLSSWLAKPLAEGRLPWGKQGVNVTPEKLARLLSWLGRIAGVVVLVTGLLMAYNALVHPQKLIPNQAQLRLHWQQWAEPQLPAQGV